MGPLHLEERLARSGPLELVEARHHLRDLILAARAVRVVAAHPDPAVDRDRCTADACVLDGRGHGRQMCAAATLLASLEIVADPQAPHANGDAAWEAPPTTPTFDPVVLADRFEHALVNATDAVRACRRTAHPGGTCWFGPLGHHDCGLVLRLAHQLGGS